MHRNYRKSSGSAITEFGPALIVLVVVVFLPVLNFGFIPVYSLVTTGALNTFTHKIALSQKRSEAYTQMRDDNGWRNALASWGIRLSNPKLVMVICGREEGEQTVVGEGEAISAGWLPGGDKGPCVYSLDLSVDADMPTMFRSITGPLIMHFASRSQWESLGRDSRTGAFYLNE